MAELTQSDRDLWDAELPASNNLLIKIYFVNKYTELVAKEQ